MVLMKPICRAAMETDIENIFLDMCRRGRIAWDEWRE